LELPLKGTRSSAFDPAAGLDGWEMT